MFMYQGMDPRPTVQSCQRLLGKIVHTTMWGSPSEVAVLVEQLESQVRVLKRILLPESEEG